MGGASTQIRYNDSGQQWVITDKHHYVRAESRATKKSYAIGKHEWTVTRDWFECSEGQPYTTLLKLSGCNLAGEFTCDDGQCVTMEQRCDQIPDCRDKSDERGCQLLVVDEGYNKNVPPITTILGQMGFVKTEVNISIVLLKIVDMEETDHKIDLQFQITLEWRENDRMVFQNLKQDSSLNALSQEDIEKIWLPSVIYDNTDQKEVTRLGMPFEWTTPVNVMKEGNFSKCESTPGCRESGAEFTPYPDCESNPGCRRSGVGEVDEMELFKGESNRMIMQQVYTWQFQCVYQLKNYPFDTQVK